MLYTRLDAEFDQRVRVEFQWFDSCGLVVQLVVETNPQLIKPVEIDPKDGRRLLTVGHVHRRRQQHSDDCRLFLALGDGRHAVATFSTSRVALGEVITHADGRNHPRRRLSAWRGYGDMSPSVCLSGLSSQHQSRYTVDPIYALTVGIKS